MSMKKRGLAVILSALMVLALAACGNDTAANDPTPTPTAATNTQTPAESPEVTTPAPTEEPEPVEEGSPFAGEYDLYCEEKDMYCEEFVIDPDGTVHGVVESSGLTSFTGTVSEDGTITGEVTRLGGTLEGTITEDLQVQVHFEVRGSTSDFVGGPL